METSGVGLRTSSMVEEHAQHLLQFRSLFRQGRNFAFPCDESGRVDIDALNERARNDYFFARIVMRREPALPAVVRCARSPKKSLELQ